ncbi:MAG: RNA polymerase sigma factor [Bacteroidetes bacterium]|nr:MAG: RNA polymerase sigma factor [Bacteroidota bacterium]
MIDPQLLHACKEQDRKAQAELYRRCYSMLMGVCIRYLKQEEEARAVLNLGFLKILNNLHKYQPKVPFEAWIRRIMINTVIDEYRKNKRHKATIAYTDFDDRQHEEAFIDFNEADQQFDAKEIERMIQQLPGMSQQVFNLYAIDGYSHKEIGKMLGISVGTSKWHVSFARKKIRFMLAEAMRTNNTKIYERE